MNATEELSREIAELEKLESELRFDRFDSDVAWGIGQAACERAKREGKVVEIDVEFDGHCLFHHAVKGWKPEFTLWIDGKKVAAKQYGISTLRLHLMLQAEGKTFAEKHPEHSALNNAVGGGFPIRMKGDDAVRGWVTLTGLPHREDHDYVVTAIRQAIARS